MVETDSGVAKSVMHVPVKDAIGGSNPSSTATILPEITFAQEGHKLFAIMGYNHQFAAHRIPRQFLHMNEEEQKWFLNSQGIAKKLLKKLGLLK